MDMLTDGVPPDTVAIIDDSGGTLTAPILEEFTAVVCKGGSVRSHLGILTREYQIPCLMNAQVAGLAEGDRVQVEYSVPAKVSYSAEEEGQGHARVWKLT
jgi:signal transduction protein with GAF and PtsI domain